MSCRLLWLLVAYGNMSQVDSFVDYLGALPGANEFGFAMCDNTAVPTASRHFDKQGTVLISRPDNPGYLEGALLAFESWVAEHGYVPDWVVISNTDLRIETGNPLDVLSAQPHSEVPVILAPRITEGAARVEKNPHLVERRSLRRLRHNRIIASTPLMAMLYQSMGVLRLRLGLSRGGPRMNTEEWALRHPPGTKFYSPYGATMFFSRSFFSQGGWPRRVPLLAEEYFVAEAAREIGAPVVYEPRIHVHHDAHTTTGPKINWQRAKGTSRAFREIYQHAREGS